MKKTEQHGWTDKVYYITRVCSFLLVFLMFFPALNPGRLSALINKNLSVFTSAISYKSLIADAALALRREYVTELPFRMIQVASILICIGIVMFGVMGCMSLGNLRMKRTGNWMGFVGGLLMITGLGGIVYAYGLFLNCARPDKMKTVETLPTGFMFFAIFTGILFLTSIIEILFQPRAKKTEKYEKTESKI